MRQPFDTSHDSEAMTEILRYSVIVVVVVVVVFVGMVFFVVIIVTVVVVVLVTSTEFEGYDAPIATLHKSRFNINDRYTKIQRHRRRSNNQITTAPSPHNVTPAVRPFKSFRNIRVIEISAGHRHDRWTLKLPTHSPGLHYAL